VQAGVDGSARQTSLWRALPRCKLSTARAASGRECGLAARREGPLGRTGWLRAFARTC